MDLTRFKGCAEAYGADRRRWPGREHALYDRFAGTPEGAAILAEAERTDRFLDALEVAAPDAALGRAITNLPSQRSGAGGRRRFWISAPAFSARALLRFPLRLSQGRGDG